MKIIEKYCFLFHELGKNVDSNLGIIPIHIADIEPFWKDIGYNFYRSTSYTTVLGDKIVIKNNILHINGFKCINRMGCSKYNKNLK